MVSLPPAAAPDSTARSPRTIPDAAQHTLAVTFLLVGTALGCTSSARPLASDGGLTSFDSAAPSEADAAEPREAGFEHASDAMPADDAGGDDSGFEPPTGSGPLLVPEDGVWTFVPVDGMRCGNGSPTGVGVNLNRTSGELLVYFQGGGACWNQTTCSIGTANRIRSGYGPEDLANDAFSEWFMFRRDESENPFREMSFVIVPYCTGDVHAGTRTETGPGRTVLHHGARNVDALIPQLRRAFPDTGRVVLAGTSAGGFGAQLNYEKFASAFPDQPVDLVADGAQLVNPAGGLVTEWVNAWGIEIPSDCEGCSEDFPRYLEYLFRRYPRAGFGLLASMRDATLTPFFNYGVNAQAYRDATADVLDLYDRSAGGAYFARAGVRHGYLEKVANLDRRANAESFAWLKRVLEGERPRRRP
jgi:hypothetical protein